MVINADQAPKLIRSFMPVTNPCGHIPSGDRCVGQSRPFSVDYDVRKEARHVWMLSGVARVDKSSGQAFIRSAVVDTFILESGQINSTMRRRSSTNGSRRSSIITKRRSENRCFDEFGFALTKRKDQKLYHRCHEYRCGIIVHSALFL